MATLEDARRIASQLPGAVEGTEGFGFSVMVKGKHKGFVWAWNERVEPKKPRVPNFGVLAICVKNLDIKDMLLSSDERALFDEPHYRGFPAVLVRLDQIDVDRLEALLIEAWRVKAPSNLVKQFDQG